GVGAFALLLVASTFGLWTVVPLTRREALRRIDRASGLAHRPASVLDDRLATAGRDPSTDALWALHRRRAEAEAAKLRAGAPSPRAVELDRYALRAGVVVALVACAVVAGPQRYARVAAAFDFGEGAASGPGYRMDAWIDPPPYTGRAPVLLDLAAARRDPDRPRTIAVPAGSVVIVRSSGGSPAEIETTGPLLPPAKKPAAKDTAAKEATRPAGDSETRLVLHGDSRLVLRHAGALRGIFDLTAIADKPPTIALREVPKSNFRGTLTLAYTTGDDYGVSRAEAVFSDPMIDGRPIQGPSLVPAPKAELALPGTTGGIGDAETTIDLTDHPWAGAQVKMVLVAHDEGGNEGRSEPVTITLPEKPFSNPVARALVEQRRNLVLEPRKRKDVAAALDALMIAPEQFGTTPSVYLGLRFASSELAAAQTDPQLLEVADFLWAMAQQIENGNLSDAEKALRNAQKALRDAIDHHAPDQEVQKLTKELQAAMDKYLKELAEQQKSQDQQQAQNQQQQQNGRSKSITQKDLQALLDKAERQARAGDTEGAKKTLQELQDKLDNLKAAKNRKADPQARAMAEGLNQLDQAMRDQQDLRDQTFKQGQQDQQGQQGQKGQQPGDEDGQMPAGRDPGQSQGMNAGPGQKGERQGRNGEGQGPNGQSGENGEQGMGNQGSPGQGQEGLSERQKELRDRLAQIQKKLKQAGEGQGDLDAAGKAMREAEDALRQGEGGNNEAVDSQGRALEAMRKGAKKLADAMSQQGDPNGQANSDSDGGQGSREGEQSGDSDPLGRPRGGNNTLNSLSRFDPLGIPAAQRAQRVLEELRRRLGDPSRSQEEIDYLERLLRSY
ncbi:MAG: TIGR02302 family protein, partial [Caulobacteraceae bacterium]|nr:TIGR02302 family protein [Caulobacter sp.]